MECGGSGRWLLGLDVGTTTAKAVLLEAESRVVVEEVSRQHDAELLNLPPGRHEQNPQVLVDSLVGLRGRAPAAPPRTARQSPGHRRVRSDARGHALEGGGLEQQSNHLDGWAGYERVPDQPPPHEQVQHPPRRLRHRVAGLAQPPGSDPPGRRKVGVCGGLCGVVDAGGPGAADEPPNGGELGLLPPTLPLLGPGPPPDRPIPYSAQGCGGGNRCRGSPDSLLRNS